MDDAESPDETPRKASRAARIRRWRIANALSLDYGVLGRRVYEESLEDDVVGLAAELAFRLFLALFPFAIFLTALGAFVAASLDVNNPAQALVQRLGDVLPQGADVIVQSQLQQIINNREAGIPFLSALFALVFATGGMNAIIKAMNRVYDVEEARPIQRRYAIALLLTLVGGGGMLVAYLLFGPIRILAPQIAQLLGLGQTAGLLVDVLSLVGALALVVTAATLVYRIAPNIRLPVRTLVPGALMAALGWVIVSDVLNIYVANYGSYANTYGALAGVAVLMIWFYASALVFLVCGEINAVVHEMIAPRDLHRRQVLSKREAEQQRLDLSDSGA